MDRYGTSTCLQFEKAIKEIDKTMCEIEIFNYKVYNV